MKLRMTLTAPLLAAACLPLGACGSDKAPPSSLLQVREAKAALTDELTYLVVYELPSVPSNAKSVIEKAGGNLVASYPNIGVAVARSTSETFAEKLSKNFLVDAVAPTTGAGINALPTQIPGGLRATRAPTPTNDEALGAMQWNMDQIRVPQAHAITKGRKSVVVGVIDSGIDDNVPDLVGQVDHSRSVTCIGGAPDTDASNWSNDFIGHGTHVGGVIAAKDDGKGVLGVAPGVSLAAVKVTEDGFIYPEAFICGMYWAAEHDFDLVNASLFVDPWYYACPSDPTQAAIIKATQRAVSYASLRGVTTFAAAGNEQQDLAHKTQDPFSPTDGETVERTIDNSCKNIPIDLDGVVGISSIAASGQLAYYSNYGLGSIDLTAPGGDFHVPTDGNESGQILSTIPSYSFYYQIAYEWGGRVAVNCTDGLDPNDENSDPSTCAETYALLQGTSQAVPHATGVAALALSRYGDWFKPLLKAKLASSAPNIACPAAPYQPFPDEMPPEVCEGSSSYNGFYGAGRVDALNAVKLF